MALNAVEEKLVAELQHGLTLVPRPWRALGERVGLTEQEVLDGVRTLLHDGVIKRVGVVVNHRALGLRANAMVVWDVPDARVDAAGEWLGCEPAVTLCYRRPRRAPRWPYNLFCMIHGRDRGEVRERIRALREGPHLAGAPYSVLFSTRCFRQRGARYRFGAVSGGRTT